MHVDVFQRLATCYAAIPENGDEIADPYELLEPVRDIDDRHALRLQIRDHAKQNLDFGRAQRGGRLVHDKDANVLSHGFRNLDELLLADHQILDPSARVDRRAQAVHDGRGLALLCGMVDVATAHDLAIGENILRHREIAEQVEFLEHHADAVPHCVGGVRKDHGLALEQNASGRRPFDASDNLHQRRFSGAVLADEHVDGAAPDFEIRLLHSNRAGIDFRHAFKPQDDVGVAQILARFASWLRAQHDFYRRHQGRVGGG